MRNLEIIISTFKLMLICALLTACGKQGDGIAPSRDQSQTPPTPTPVPVTNDVSSESTFKYGQNVTLGNGWNVSIGTTDSVKYTQLVSGWEIEVKYE